ncbi:Glutamate Receptor 4 [Manis pentadactyla]|nr:Glutamate Receptor 4 [Manis pentadactyla]
MHMIRLRREFGFNSDLSARGECEIQFQDYSEAIVVSMVILEFQATGPRLETLALRKELGSWSDVTGVQDVGTGLWLRCLIRSMGEIGLQLDSDPSTIKDNFRIKGDVWLTLMLKLKCRILTPGLGLELVRH